MERNQRIKNPHQKLKTKMKMVNQIVIIFRLTGERSTRWDKELGRIEGAGGVDTSVLGFGLGGWIWDDRCRLGAVTG